MKHSSAWVGRSLVVLAGLAGWGAAGWGAAPASPAVTLTNYHGWPGALHMDNGVIEAVVVPEVGRLMHLSLKGGANVIWENRALDGHRLDGRQTAWVNLGGDKSWPAPEGEWGRYTGEKHWFPPRGFDGLPAVGKVENGEIILTSAVDRHYGIRVVRRFQMRAGEAQLVVRTDYECVQGQRMRVGIWIITQLREPEGVFIPLPEKSRFTNGYVALSRTAPPSLRAVEEGRMLALVRDRRDSYKIGTDASSLIWVGADTVVRIDSPRVVGLEYPDQGSSAEVYTNGGELEYVELEMLGPLRVLGAGETISQTNVYTLRRRMEKDPLQAAKAMMK